MNWIRITDEIPPTNTPLLVKSWNSNRFFYAVAILIKIKTDDDKTYIWIKSDDLEPLDQIKACGMYVVSHWCKFPEITLDMEAENTADMYDFKKQQIFNGYFK